MPQYDIRESIGIAGLDIEVHAPPGATTEWTVVEIEAERIRMEYGTRKVWIEQRGPRESDLPFRVLRLNQNDDEYRLDEGDWLTDVWPTAEAYMLGVEEGVEQQAFM